MTVQAGIEISLELLVGEMPDLGCEHLAHEYEHADGPATHYSMYHCPSCERHVDAEPVCQFWVSMVEADINIRCRGCSKAHPASRAVRILGRVKP